MARKTHAQEAYERIIQEARVSVIGNIPAAVWKLEAQLQAVVTTANQTDALFSEFTNEVFHDIFEEVQEVIGKIEADETTEYLDEDEVYRVVSRAHAAAIDSFICCYGVKDVDVSSFPSVKLKSGPSTLYKLCSDKSGMLEIDDPYLRNCENDVERNNGEVYPEEIASLTDQDMMCGFYDAGHHFYSSLPILQSRWDFFYHLRNEAIAETLMDMLPVVNIHKYDQSVDYKNAVKSCFEEAMKVFNEELKRGLDALPRETEESRKEKKLKEIELQLQSLEKERLKLERSITQVKSTKTKLASKK